MSRKKFEDLGALTGFLKRQGQDPAERFEKHPDWLVEAWQLLSEPGCDVKRRVELAGMLIAPLSRLSQQGALGYLGLLADPNGRLAASYLHDLCVEGLHASVALFRRAGNGELMARVAERIMRSGNPALWPIFRSAANAVRSSDLARRNDLATATDTLLGCILGRRLPLPSCPATQVTYNLSQLRTGGEILVHDPVVRTLHLSTMELDDPKDLWVLEPFGLNVSDEATLRAIGRLSGRLMNSYFMPEECTEHIDRAVPDCEAVVREIKALWSEIQTAVASRKIRCWAMNDGGVEATVGIGGEFSPSATGIAGIAFYPGRKMPEMKIAIDYHIFAAQIRILDPIGDTGTLVGLTVYDVGSKQWKLRALINRAAVRWLHSVALPVSNRKKHRSGQNGEGKGEPFLPCFRALPAGYTASSDACCRARDRGWPEPPEGMTFAASRPTLREQKGWTKAAARKQSVEPRKLVLEFDL